MHALYRCRGLKWAGRKLQKMTDLMAKSALPEIKTLRKTLMRWRAEILNFFVYGLTNARTEESKDCKKANLSFPLLSE